MWVGTASARLPRPRSTLIVPGTSIGGVKLGMTQSEVFHVWGSTGCSVGVCTWWGPGNRSHAERATVSLHNGQVIQIDINAATSGVNEKFRPGTLSKWKTGKHIGLGSTRRAVKRAYPAAKANTSTGVAGYDLFAGGDSLLDDRVRELHDRSAFHADEVVVMAVPVGMLVLSRSVVRTGAPREARFGEELDGAKHGRLADARVDAPYRCNELVGGDVALGIQEGAEDRFTGLGHLQAALAKVALENRSWFVLHSLLGSL